MCFCKELCFGFGGSQLKDFHGFSFKSGSKEREDVDKKHVLSFMRSIEIQVPHKESKTNCRR